MFGGFSVKYDVQEENIQVTFSSIYFDFTFFTTVVTE